jgi:hypothetical protein
MTEFLNNKTQLGTLVGTGECVRRAMENQLLPWLNGKGRGSPVSRSADRSLRSVR